MANYTNKMKMLNLDGMSDSQLEDVLLRCERTRDEARVRVAAYAKLIGLSGKDGVDAGALLSLLDAIYWSLPKRLRWRGTKKPRFEKYIAFFWRIEKSLRAQLRHIKTLALANPPATKREMDEAFDVWHKLFEVHLWYSKFHDPKRYRLIGQIDLNLVCRTSLPTLLAHVRASEDVYKRRVRKLLHAVVQFDMCKLAYGPNSQKSRESWARVERLKRGIPSRILAPLHDPHHIRLSELWGARRPGRGALLLPGSLRVGPHQEEEHGHECPAYVCTSQTHEYTFPRGHQETSP